MALLRVLLPVLAVVSAVNLYVMGAKAVPAVGLGVESSVQLEGSAGISAELESADLFSANLKGGELRSIQAAPGFSERSIGIESLLKSPSTVPQTLEFPIAPNNFLFSNGSVGLASGLVNQQYFRSCFHGDYGVLGGTSDRVLGGPLTATADSGVSPFLDDAAIKRLQSLKVHFRYGFSSNTRSSTLKLYLTNLTTGRVQFLGNLKATSNLKNPCATVSKDVTHLIREPGVYGIRFVMNSRIVKMPVMLDAAAPDRVDDRIRPQTIRPQAVAGFNGVVVKVTRRGTGALLVK
jgi:hypothetical protein